MNIQALQSVIHLLFPKNLLVFIAIFWLFAGAIAFMGIALRIKKRAGSRPVMTILRNVFLVGLIPSLITVAVHFMAVYLQRAFNQLNATLQTQVLLAVATLVFGFAAYFWKLVKQFWYGLVEVVAAVLFTMAATANIDPSHPNHLATNTAILGSAYVIVRGLTNMTEGSLGKVETLDQFVEKFLAKLGNQ